MSIAFVLSGGGSKGSFQVGVMKQLAEKGIAPETIYGTSVGALNAAGYAYIGPEHLENVWRAIKGDADILYPTGWRWAYAWTRLVYSDGIYSLKNLKTKVEDLIHGMPRCKAVAVYVSLKTGQIHYTNNIDSDEATFRDAVMGSSAIPGIMEPAVNDWVDGGVREVCPLNKAIDDGHSTIYVIMTNPINDLPDPWIKGSKWMGWLKNVYRAVDDIMNKEVLVNDIEYCQFFSPRMGYKKIDLHVYAPDQLLITTLDFSPAKIAANIDLGYRIGEYKW